MKKILACLLALSLILGNAYIIPHAGEVSTDSQSGSAEEVVSETGDVESQAEEMEERTEQDSPSEAENSQTTQEEAPENAESVENEETITDKAASGVETEGNQETEEEFKEDAELYTEVSGDYKYTISGNEATITAYSGSERDLTIPSTINGYTVTAIGSEAFKNNTSIENVVLLREIKLVGSSAFADCTNLSSVTFTYDPKTLDGMTLYYNCDVESRAFSGCSGLKEVNLSENVTSLGIEVFYGCSSLRELIIPEGVKSLGSRFIYGTEIKTITIPKSVTSVDYKDYGGPLAGSNVTTVIFAEGIKKIPGNICDFGGKYSSYIKRVLIPEGVEYIEDYAFAYCTSLSSITVPKTVYTIDTGAFDHCTSMESIVISEGVKEIGSSAFSYCISLSSVTLPKTMSRIRTCAFEYCTGLSSVTFTYNPEMVYTEKGEKVLYECWLDTDVFRYCSELKEVNLSGNITILNDRTFVDCSSLTELTIPEGVKTLGCSFISGTGIKTITIPKSVIKASPDGAFVSSKVTTVIFAKGTKNIPSYICAGTNDYYGYRYGRIERVVIPEGVEYIGHAAFAGNERLESIVLPKTISEIDGLAFENCTNLSSVTFTYNPKMVTTADNKTQLYSCSVGGSAFYGCSRLKDVNLSENVTSLGSYAFHGCGLTELIIPEGVKSLGTGFIRWTGIKTITVPKSVTEIDIPFGSSDKWGPFTDTQLTTVIFEEGTTNIPSYICSAGNCDSFIEKVFIPATVTSIGEDAFYGCNLMTIYGTPGSYAETYANLNSIPFVNVATFYENLYKNADYEVRVLNKENGQPIAGAEIFIDGASAGKTDQNGNLKINVYGTATQSVKVSKAGFRAMSYTGIPWTSSILNTVYLEPTAKMEDCIEDLLPSTSLGTAQLKGPHISMLGHDFNLFETEISFDIPFFDDMVVKNDPDKKTIKVVLGMSDSQKAKLQAADPDDVYWSESYQEVKSLVKACGGKVDGNRVWNQFSSLRGKLKKINGTASLAVSGSSTGFMEFSYADGTLKMVDSGIAANLTGNAGMHAPLFWIVYAEVELEVGADGTMNLKLNKQQAYDLSGSIGLNIAPMVAIGANAVVADVQGGLKGSMNGTFSFPATTMREALAMSISGNLFIKISSPVPFMNGQKSMDLGTLELYPNFGAYLDLGDWELEFEDRVTPGAGEAYEYADTQVVTLADGTKVKVYVTDDGTKSTGNHTTLMYSVYKNGAWQPAAAVKETGHADMKPVLRSDGNLCYVVWMNIGKTISTNMEADQIFPYCDLWLSTFDGNAFTAPERVSDDGNKKMEFNYDLAVENGTAAVVWVENSDNDPFMENGRNTIYSRLRNADGTWQAKTSMTSSYNYIAGVAASLGNGSISVSYTDGEQTYMVSGTAKTTVGAGSGSKVFDGVTYYISESKLYEIVGGSSIDTGIMCSSDYKVFGDTVFWTTQSGFGSELYMQSFDQKLPVQITRDGGYISSFTIYKDTDNKTYIDYVWMELTGNETDPYGKSYDKTIQVTSVFDLAVTEVMYDANKVAPNETVDFAIHAVNCSTDAVKDVHLRIKGRNNKVLYNEVIFDKMEAGEEKTYLLSYQLPADLAGLSLVFDVYCEDAEEENLKNNKYSVSFSDTDLVITETAKDHIKLVNNGYAAASNVKVEMRQGGADGELIDTYKVGTMASGAENKVEISIPSKYLDFSKDNTDKLFWISASSDTSEVLSADNDAILTVEAPKVTGVDLKTKELTVAVGKTKKLEAVVSAEDSAVQKLSWCSADTGIATVDENGAVKGIAVGETDITVIEKNSGLVATCHVTVEEGADTPDLESITLSKSEVTLKEGDTYKLTYTVQPETEEDLSERCIWTSSEQSVAEVKDGTITALKEGTTKITLTIDGVSAECMVTVTKPAVTDFELSEIEVTAYNKLTIRWTKYEGADGYLIYRQESDGKYSTLKNLTSVDTTSYTTTVTSGVKYTYKVAAYQSSENKEMILAETKPKSQTALPAAPSLTNADMTAYNKIRLQWTKVSGCEGYVIYRSTSEDGTYKVLKSLAEPATIAYVNVVTSSEDYYYKMRAYVTVDGKKMYGNYSNVMKGNVITGPPSGFTVQQVKDTKIKFTWDKVEDAEGYVIYMATEQDGTYKAIKNITDINTLTYSKNVTAGQKYYFYMKAYRITNGKKVYSVPTEVFSN